MASPRRRDRRMVAKIILRQFEGYLLSNAQPAEAAQTARKRAHHSGLAWAVLGGPARKPPSLRSSGKIVLAGWAGRAGRTLVLCAVSPSFPGRRTG